MKLPRSERICGNCVYFYPDTKEDWDGECRYTPEYCFTTGDRWCGKGMWIEVTETGEWHFNYSANDEGEGYFCKNKADTFPMYGGGLVLTNLGGSDANTEK